MLPRRTVLVVDDDPDVVASVSALFHQFQFQVFSAQTPTHALRIAQQPTIPIDLLVTDVHMPEMNGIELAKAIRSLRPSTTTIYISGDREAETMVRSADKRSPFLLKPFTLFEMQDVVQKALIMPAGHKEDPRAVRCPQCAATNVRSSHPQVFELFIWPILAPNRCRECRTRFYRLRLTRAVIGGG